MSSCVGWNWRRCLPWLLLVLFSLTLHLWDLGGRSYHHDESIHAQNSYILLKDGIYRYDPTYHGPLLYYLTAATFAVAGDSDFTARLPIALAGILLIGVAWSLRRPLGARAAWWTGLLATISPIWLYYGRFLRMDILEVFVASAAAVAAWRAFHGSSRAWVWVGVWTALAFATKENAFVTSALVGFVMVLMLARGGLRRTIPAALEWMAGHRWQLVTMVAAAVIVSVPLFTLGFTHPGDWFFPYKAISYWWGQHAMERVGGPPWYHLPRLALYEFLPIIAALAWAVRRGRRMRGFEISLLLFGLASIGMYCYLGEKVPWLGVHQVWAFLPLAGLQMARTFGPRGVWWSRTLATVGLAATLVTSFVANFVLDEISPNRDRVEALIYVQTCPEMLEPVTEGYRLLAEGADPAAAVAGEASWPLSWYWRSSPIWWGTPKAGMHPPLVFLDTDDQNDVRRSLGPGYSSERIPLRAWWVMENQRPSLSEIVRYVFTRRPWGIVGSTDTIVLSYTGAEGEAEAAHEVPVPTAIAEAFAVDAARIIGTEWMIEPRGLAAGPDGQLVAADVGLGEVVFFDSDGKLIDKRLPEKLNQPEDVAWIKGGVLAIADTWNHRVLLYNPVSDSVRPLPEPDDGWYGPRAVAVAPDGTVAVSDTGHKRIVLISMGEGGPRLEVIGAEGAGPGQLVEPVGITWLDDQRLLVCDTGNHRLQVLDRRGQALEVVPLPGAWKDFYSRPQVMAFGEGDWLLTDPPGRCLWRVTGNTVTKIDLTDSGITPTGLARDDDTLYVADLNSRVWAFDLSPTD